MRFTKMHGCGNDYIYIDGAREKVPQSEKPALVRRLSDRHFGIGADGVIFINPSVAADFEMEMYNADGSRAEMCGNGIRCVAKYVYDKGLTDKKKISIESAGKIKQLNLTVQGGQVIMVKVNMGRPEFAAKKVPVRSKRERVIDELITVGGTKYHMTCVSMGNPHAVVFAGDVEELELGRIGPLFENHRRFPKKVNVEFVKVLDEGCVKMRVWERGTGETLACGTGACAAVAACIMNGFTREQVTVKLPGGELEIYWDAESGQMFMTGPARTVFEGDADL